VKLSTAEWFEVNAQAKSVEHLQKISFVAAINYFPTFMDL